MQCSVPAAQAQYSPIASHENDGTRQSEGEKCPHVLVIWLF